MSKHTPGPWVQWEGHGLIVAGTPATNDRGRINGFKRQVCELLDVEGETDAADTPEDQANANLIKAAPDLLAELKRCRDYNKVLLQGLTSRTLRTLVDDADAAITKAEGAGKAKKQPPENCDYCQGTGSVTAGIGKHLYPCHKCNPIAPAAESEGA